MTRSPGRGARSAVTNRLWPVEVVDPDRELAALVLHDRDEALESVTPLNRLSGVDDDEIVRPDGDAHGVADAHLVHGGAGQ